MDNIKINYFRLVLYSRFQSIDIFRVVFYLSIIVVYHNHFPSIILVFYRQWWPRPTNELQTEMCCKREMLQIYKTKRECTRPLEGATPSD